MTLISQTHIRIAPLANGPIPLQVQKPTSQTHGYILFPPPGFPLSLNYPIKVLYFSWPPVGLLLPFNIVFLISSQAPALRPCA